MPRLLSLALLTAAFLGGCDSPSRLLELIDGALPPDTGATLTESCTPFMGPFVGLFTLPNGPLVSPEGFQRFPSLSDFVQSDADCLGACLGATVLDGKECLRKLTNRADDILFAPTPGLYRWTNNRKVIVVLFDDPAGEGLIFVQAP